MNRVRGDESVGSDNLPPRCQFSPHARHAHARLIFNNTGLWCDGEVFAPHVVQQRRCFLVTASDKNRHSHHPMFLLTNISHPFGRRPACFFKLISNQLSANCPLHVLPPCVPVRDPPTANLSALQFQMTFHQVLYGQIKSSV